MWPTQTVHMRPFKIVAPTRGLALVVTLSLLPTFAVAQHPTTIALTDFTSGSIERNVTGCQISPDGEWVAYSLFFENSPGTFTSQVRLRRADGAGPGPVVVRSVTGASPALSWTWRWDGTRSTLVLATQSPVGVGLIEEYVPLGAVTPLYAVTTGATRLNLSRQPFSNRLVGARIGTTSAELFLLDLSGPTPTFTSLPSTSAGEITALDVSPDGTRALYRSDSSNYRQIVLATGAVSPAGSFGGSTADFRGFLDNATVYARVNFSGGYIGRSTTSGYTSVTDTAFYRAQLPAAAPGHLGGSGTKDFIAFEGQEVVNGVPTGPRSIRLTSSSYGGDINLFTIPNSNTLTGDISCDRSASRVAFLLVLNGGNQVFVANTNREVNSTFNNLGSTALYTAAAPCDVGEVCVIAVSSGLAASPAPWGPPGQIELDSTAVIMASGANGPISGSFSVNTGAFQGVPFFFQAIRFTATANNTSRVARVIYRN